MYAIIEDGGRQYKVAEGDRILVELRDGKAGDAIEFDRVLFLGGADAPKVGVPCIENAKVRAEVEAEVKAKKVISYKYRRREGYHRKVGHRQRHLRIRITQIVAPSGV